MANQLQSLLVITSTIILVLFLHWNGVECSASSNGTDSANILCVFPTMSKSHLLGTRALLKNLAKRGHNVTMVSSFPLSESVENYRDVYVPIENTFAPMMTSFMQGDKRELKRFMPNISKAALDASNYTINSPQFQKLVEEEQFDVVIVGYFMNDFLLGIQSWLNCPTILYFSSGIGSMIDVVGNPFDIAAVPHPALGYKNPMTFFDRVKNTYLYMREFVGLKTEEKYVKRYYDSNFPAEEGFPSYKQAKLNVSLVMFNSYFTQTLPRPYLPNLVEVGGLQIKSEPDPLPEDIKAWLDGAEEDAILLSFGTNLKSSDLRQDKYDAIIKSLSRLRQRVIWKWDAHKMRNKPKNVLIKEWLPQDDILAHKKVKLFVTHGGWGSVTEAMYHGVPIVGIPMFGDQIYNIAHVVRKGWGVSVSFDVLDQKNFTAAIREVLGNTSYANSIQAAGSLFKDRPQTPLELATFWVEYVVRHKGAKHLHYQGADLNVLQRNLVDVVAFLLGIPLLITFGIVYLIPFAIRRVKQRDTFKLVSITLRRGWRKTILRVRNLYHQVKQIVSYALKVFGYNSGRNKKKGKRRLFGKSSNTQVVLLRPPRTKKE